MLVLLSPLYLILSLLVFLFSGWPIFFIQERVGYKGKVFKMFKFRTMRVGADEEQEKLRKLNEADGPVFKIKNDPRFTKIGIFLSHSGLDELPQFLNVFLGDMEIIGPRPLPVKEALKVPEKYRSKRESAYPGVISPWVVDGYHSLTFQQWMESDLKYVKNKSFLYDVNIFLKGILIFGKLIIGEIRKSLI